MNVRNLVLTITLLCSTIPVSLAQYDSIQHGSRHRSYLLHLPPSYVSGTPMPLIIAMHGGGGFATNMQNQSQLSVKADAAGFIVVYPEGVKGLLGIRTWNAGGCCGYAMNNNIDDVGFISTLIDKLAAKYSIDSERVYATGMSNGAFMAYRLACELSNKIAAIAPVAGSMNVAACTPGRGVPVIHFHSVLDESVPYQGGVGTGVSGHYNPPIDSVLNVWGGLNSCGGPNETIYSGADYSHTRWTNCNCEKEVDFYLTEDGGHSWPGGQQTVVGGPPSTAISANDLMWDFFQQHTLTCTTTGTGEVGSGKEGFAIFPNPFSSQTTIQIAGFVQNATLTIYNAIGQKIKETNNLSGTTILLNREGLRHGQYFVRLTEKTKLIFSGKLAISDP